MKKISIIIPCKRIDSFTEKSIRECLKLDYDSFEILILPDDVKKYRIKDGRLKIITTGEVVPAVKRNIGIKRARGDFYAFIDSDAYPEKDWLKNSMKYFKNGKIGIVGGPNVTPPDVNFWERVSGHVLSNFLISGHASRRYKRSKKRCFVMELPSCNYIVRKEAASEYDSRFLTAEDTKFCLDSRKKGFKVLYAPDVVVHHHRRDTLKKYLKQMFFYGRDNLWLFKEEPSTDKIYFFITMLGILGFLGGVVLSFIFPLVRILFLIFIGVYLLAVFFTSIYESLKMTLAVFLTSIGSHFMHGLGSFYGLFNKRKRVLNER